MVSRTSAESMSATTIHMDSVCNVENGDFDNMLGKSSYLVSHYIWHCFLHNRIHSRFWLNSICVTPHGHECYIRLYVHDDSLQRCRIQFLQIQAQILWSVYMHTEWCAKTMILNVTLSYDSFAKFFSWITTIMEELSSMCCPSVQFCLAALFFFFFFLVHRECYINILHMWQRIAVVFQSWQSHMLSRYHSDHSPVYVCYCTVEQTFNLKTVSVCKVYLHWLLHTCTTLTIFYIPL